MPEGGRLTLRFRRARNDNRSGGHPALSGDRLLVATMQCASRWLAPLVAVAVLGAVATLALPAVLGHALDEIVAAARSGPGAGSGTGSGLGAPLLVAAALVVLVVVTDVAANLVAGAATAESTGLLRREVAGQVLDAGPALAEGSPEGDLVARLVANTTTAARSVVVVSGLAAATLPPVGAVVALGLIDPWLALTFVTGMISASGAVRTYLRDSRKATAGYLEAQGAIASRLVDALAGARTIAAARTAEREVARVLAPLADVRRHGVAVWRNIARLAFQGEPVVLLTQAAVVAVAGVGVAAGRLTPGEVLAASRYAVMAAGIGGILDELAALTRARAGADRIAELLDAPIVRHGRRRLPPGPGTLELRNITTSRGAPVATSTATAATSGPTGFAATVAGTTGRPTGPDGTGQSGGATGPGAAGGAGGVARAGVDGCDADAEGGVGGPVLSGLDLVVPGGRAVALVGRSGSGKSLVAALAGRLCDPGQGEVLLDGVPLRELDRRTLRRAVTYAFERPELPGTTIAGAIGFGADDPTPDRIRAAAVAARADPFIARLPAGYDAVLAETPLSGGEVQRLGLARALAPEARLVILDDATSSLDTATEAQIAAALTATMAGRTRLVVTHRLATAARADLVAWLAGGKVRACAPHRDLWSDPAYRAIFHPNPEPEHSVAEAADRAGPADRADSPAVRGSTAPAREAAARHHLASLGPGEPPRAEGPGDRPLPAGPFASGQSGRVAPEPLVAGRGSRPPVVPRPGGDGDRRTDGAGERVAAAAHRPALDAEPPAAGRSERQDTQARDEPESGLRPEPDHEREDEPPPPSAPPGLPEVPADDDVAASAVAATANDPLAAVDVQNVARLATGATA